MHGKILTLQWVLNNHFLVGIQVKKSLKRLQVKVWSQFKAISDSRSALSATQCCFILKRARIKIMDESGS